MKIQTFEKWLEEEQWEPEGVLDDDMPDAFEAWLEGLDTQEVMDYAEEWGQKCRLDGKEEILKNFEKPIRELETNIHATHIDIDELKDNRE